MVESLNLRITRRIIESCFNWNLTGLPCIHGIACIREQRQNPEDFVDDAYTKAKYLATYTPSIRPMPGPSQWEHIRLPDPLPPVHKKMPGRPSSKKRRKEPGESETTRVKRVKKANKCSNCGELGHYKRTCKKAAAPLKQPSRGGKPPSNTEWAKAEKRKALKAAYKAQIGSHSTSQSTTTVNDFPTQASSSMDVN